MKTQNRISLAIVLAVEIIAAPATFGNAIRFDFGPAGTPAVTALFEDVGLNQVNLTITAPGLVGNNSVNSLFFNFNPAFDSHNLIFTQTSSIGGVQGSANNANDSYKVSGGGGKFDIKLDFNQAPAFIAGNSVTYSITGVSGFSVSDFLFLQTPAAGRIPTYAAGSLQELSGIVVVNGSPQTVPDGASTFSLLALCLTAFPWAARRFRTLI